MKKLETGDSVRVMQLQLNQAGFKVLADGWFGDSTEAAVKAFQRSVGLVEDGIAGPKTLTLLKTGKKDSRLLSQSDLERAAQRLDVPVAAIHAVNEIESRGHGFLQDGRPVILYERHVMFERLENCGQDAAALSKSYPAVINKARGGYSGGSAEYVRLNAAIGIDQTCAIESASWGQFQIMGYRYEMAGYKSATEFVADMYKSESKQLDAFVSFIEFDPLLHKALKSRKWAEFARIYNGPAYKENLYDVKLARAYDRYAAEEATA